MMITLAEPYSRNCVGPKMAEVFADTSGWAAWLVNSEPLHTAADALMSQWQKSKTGVVTTNYVLTEVAALLTSPLRVPRPTQILFFKDLRTSSWVDIVHIDVALDSQSWTLFETRPDKKWSLVDCASFGYAATRHLRGFDDGPSL